MTGAEFRAARDRLGLTQRELAEKLKYSAHTRISEIEARAEVDPRIAMLMQALLEGWRPADWDGA